MGLGFVGAWDLGVEDSGFRIGDSGGKAEGAAFGAGHDFWGASEADIPDAGDLALVSGDGEGRGLGERWGGLDPNLAMLAGGERSQPADLCDSLGLKGGTQVLEFEEAFHFAEGLRFFGSPKMMVG